MAGDIAAWGKSRNTHDKLIKSLRPLTKKTDESFQKISSHLGRIRELSEEIGKFAANLASMEYPTEKPEGAASSVPVETIARTLDMPRHEMKPNEVSFYRSRLQTIFGIQQKNVAEVDKLAGIIRQRRDCLKKILAFYAQQSPKAAKRSKPR